MAHETSRFSWLDAGLCLGGAVLLGAAMVALRAYQAAAIPLLPPLEAFEGSLPTSSRLLLSDLPFRLGGALCGILLVGAVGFRLARWTTFARALSTLAIVTAASLAAVAVHGHDALEALSLDVRGAVSHSSCPCPPALACVFDCECGCDGSGKLVEQLVDDDGDDVFDTAITYEYDASGRLTSSTFDRGRDGTVDLRCRFDPPCRTPGEDGCTPDCD